MHLLSTNSGQKLTVCGGPPVNQQSGPPVTLKTVTQPQTKDENNKMEVLKAFSATTSLKMSSSTKYRSPLLTKCKCRKKGQKV